MSTRAIFTKFGEDSVPLIYLRPNLKAICEISRMRSDYVIEMLRHEMRLHHLDVLVKRGLQGWHQKNLEINIQLKS